VPHADALGGADNQNGGFSDAKPWLPVATSICRARLTAGNDPGRFCTSTGDAIAFRRRIRSAKGSLRTWCQRRQIPCWRSSAQAGGGRSDLLRLQLSDHDAEMRLPPGKWRDRRGSIGAPFAAPDRAAGDAGPWQRVLRAGRNADNEKNRGRDDMADLKLTDVEKAYGGTVKVLKDINLDIKTGRADRLRRALGLRQVHASADDRGLEKITGGTLEIDGSSSTTCRPRSAASRWCSSPTRSIRT
jgi:hypothetical protein